MQFKTKKTNLILAVALLFSSIVYAEKEQSVAIQQVSEIRIKKYTKDISKAMQRKKVLKKSTLAALGCYVAYGLIKWAVSKPKIEPTAQTNSLATEQGRIDEIRLLRTHVDQLRQLRNVQDSQTRLEKAWSFCKTSGTHLFNWIAMPIMLGLATNKVQDYIASTQSIEAFDQHTTHCMELLQYLVYNLQEVAEFMNQTGQQVPLDKKDFADTCNRLLTSVEKMLGYIQAKRSMFTYRLKEEAGRLEKRLTECAQEFAEDLQDALENSDTDYRQIAQAIARFGQRYTQERQRFALIEAEAA